MVGTKLSIYREAEEWLCFHTMFLSSGWCVPSTSTICAAASLGGDRVEWVWLGGEIVLFLARSRDEEIWMLPLNFLHFTGTQ